MPITGGCACRMIRYQLNASPLIELICHCRDCQRASGGASSAGLIVPSRELHFSGGEPRFHTLTADSGRNMHRGFCEHCGSPISIRRPQTPRIELLHAASLDDPSLFRPAYEVWLSRAQPWHTLHPDTLKFEEAPPPELMRGALDAYFVRRA